MIRRAAIVFILVSLVACSVPALASQSKFASRPSIKIERSSNSDRLFGKVRSNARACEQGRKVKLLHRTVTQEARWSVVTKLRTNGKGAWSFRPQRNQNGDRLATPGNWHVKVDEVRVSSGGGTITCKEKFSSSMFVG